MQRVAQAKQKRPLRIVSVIIGDDTTQAETFADKAIRVDDLLHDRQQLRGAVADIV